MNDTQWIEALAIENVIHADATVKLGGWSVYGQVITHRWMIIHRDHLRTL